MTQAFTVNTEQELLDDLRKRIAACRWIDPIKTIDWQLGVSLGYLRDLAHYWQHEFDWRKTEESINSFPNYLTTIDGYQLHYLHIKSQSPNATPLLVLHGWPGCFLEKMKIIPLLTDDQPVSFDLVIPSLPGFGFSAKPEKGGMNAAFMARLWIKLMQQLGYEKFMVQGCDFGAIISTHMALKYAGSISALHMNNIPFNYQPYLQPGELLEPDETAALKRSAMFLQAEGAYAAIQAAKPLTLSYGLNDSPVGFCAWILQLFKSFSDPGVNIEALFTKDELLSHITLFWITQTIHSSMRLFSENSKEPLTFGKDDFIRVPVGIAKYPYPQNFPARKYIERGYNVQYWNEMPRGGHFAAMEQPELFAADLKEFAAAVLL